MTVHLLSFRIIGHPLITPSVWTEAGKGANILISSNAGQARALLRTLQTINPPYDFTKNKPFNDFPVHTSPQQTKRIIPSKKTAAIAIFAASPQLVAALGQLDPALFAVDRIEIGRRRDHSWWLNFVELSNATRWSTMAPLLDALLHDMFPADSAAVDDVRRLVTQVQGTERVKGGVAAELLAILQRLQDQLPRESAPLWQQCHDAASRADHFRKAKQITLARLPFFLSVETSGNGLPDQKTVEESESFLFLAARLQQKHPNGSGMRQALEQINHQLRARAADRRLQLQFEGNRLRLQRENSGHPDASAGTPFQEQWDNSMTVLAAMHDVLVGVPPVFLLDCSGLQLSPGQQDALLATIARQSAQAQCFVIPGGLSFAGPSIATQPPVQHLDLKLDCVLES